MDEKFSWRARFATSDGFFSKLEKWHLPGSHAQPFNCSIVGSHIATTNVKTDMISYNLTEVKGRG